MALNESACEPNRRCDKCAEVNSKQKRNELAKWCKCEFANAQRNLVQNIRAAAVDTSETMNDNNNNNKNV